MEEVHFPGPQEARGVYGFAIWIFFNFCIFAYFAWIFMPENWTSNWIYEPPQKYWGFAVPIFFCTALFFFAFFIYPALHSRHDGDLDESSAFTDEFAIEPAHLYETPSNEGPIPPVSDLPLDFVSKTLYSKRN